jgi:hypothetical protein
MGDDDCKHRRQARSSRALLGFDHAFSKCRAQYAITQ